MLLKDVDTIWTPRGVRYYATASGYICDLDLGYGPKPCLIIGYIEHLPWLTSVSVLAGVNNLPQNKHTTMLFIAYMLRLVSAVCFS